MRTTQQTVGRKDRYARSTKDPMRKDRMTNSASTSLKEAAQIKGGNRLLNLSVEKSRALTKTGMRLDLIRIVL